MAETAVAASSALSALLVKPKAAFEAFIPDKRAEDGQTRRWTPSSGSEQEETAVAATPRANKKGSQAVQSLSNAISQAFHEHLG